MLGDPRRSVKPLPTDQLAQLGIQRVSLYSGRLRGLLLDFQRRANLANTARMDSPPDAVCERGKVRTRSSMRLQVATFLGHPLLFLWAQVVTGLVIDTSSTPSSRERKEIVISYSASLVDGGFLDSAYGIGMTMPLTPDYTHWLKVKGALCITVPGAPSPPYVPAPAPPSIPDTVPGIGYERTTRPHWPVHGHALEGQACGQACPRTSPGIRRP